MFCFVIRLALVLRRACFMQGGNGSGARWGLRRHVNVLIREPRGSAGRPYSAAVGGCPRLESCGGGAGQGGRGQGGKGHGGYATELRVLLHAAPAVVCVASHQPVFMLPSPPPPRYTRSCAVSCAVQALVQNVAPCWGLNTPPERILPAQPARNPAGPHTMTIAALPERKTLLATPFHSWAAHRSSLQPWVNGWRWCRCC